MTNRSITEPLDVNVSIKGNNPQKSVKPLIITTGEPAGIGMDIVLQLAAKRKFATLQHPVWVIADEQALVQRAALLSKQLDVFNPSTWQTLITWDDNFTTDDVVDHLSALSAEDLPSLSCNSKNDTNVDFLLIDTPCQVPVEAGVLHPDNAQMVIQQLTLAHLLAHKKIACAIVTAPLQKSILIDADIRLKDGTMFTGHTEFFMQQSDCDKVVMMLANTAMMVALVTIHMPLKEVVSAITKLNVEQTISIVLNDLKTKFGIDNPRILVCGLNPHAGESGHLGMEEVEIINPVLKKFQDQGVTISDAMPADTIFTQRHIKDCDAIIAMYHDQGLPALKSHGFGDTVNLTLGLPYIRTSVDHGTALDLAGSGLASPSSLWQALLMADDMASKSGL